MTTWAAAALALGALLSASAGLAADTPRTVQERLGHPKTARLLILHADDFGMSHSVNRATSEALEKGWITSASILVPCPWFPEVARWAKAHPEADLGIHLALNSEWTGFRWRPLSDGVPSLLDPDGYLPLLEPTVAERAQIPEVEKELRAQVQKARGAGIRLSHLDSHMATLFRTAPLFDAYRKMGTEFGLPILADRANRPPAGATLADGEVLLDQVLSINPGVPPEGWRAAYERMLAPLPPGVYQLIVHLAYDDEEMRGATAGHPDWGAKWRQLDFDLVRDQGFRDWLKAQGFVLVTWKDLARARP
jgi:chitin disaccharide deacetylase